MDIILFSTQPWDDSHWTNKQHIASRLAKEHRVLYVFEDSTLVGAIKSFLTRKRNLSLYWPPFRQLNSNLWVFNPLMLLPSRYGGYAFELTKRRNCLWLKKLITQLKFRNPILWLYEPTASFYIDKIPHTLTCYDCVDEYTTIFNAGTYSHLRRIKTYETHLLKNADIVITSSRPLYEKKKIYNSNTYYIPNVADTNLFAKVHKPQIKIPDEMKEIPHPIIGYHGALSDYKLDLNLINYLAQRNSHWSFVLIGEIIELSKKELQNLKNLENSYILGKRAYYQLPSYIKAFDVCIIPYQLNDYTRYCFPIKFHEYMATGKPIVTTALPALKEYKGVIGYAKNANQFEIYIKKNLELNVPQQRQKRIEIAMKNTWEKRHNEIMELIYSGIRKHDVRDVNKVV
jgi:glycosyltransferase involved in cell wall biosynthesis